MPPDWRVVLLAMSRSIAGLGERAEPSGSQVEGMAPYWRARSMIQR
jgi:hypothetical protein